MTKRSLFPSLVLASLFLAAMLLAGCGGEEPLPTPTPTKTSVPLAAATPAPTDTPAPPTDTPTATDTPEPTATFTPEGTPTPEPTPTPAAFLQPSQDDVNTRKGPGTSYGRVGQVTRADTLGVYGKSADGGWYKVCCVNGQEAWIAAQFAQLSGNPAAIAVVEAPPLNAETQADSAPSSAGRPGPSASGIGYVYIGNVVPPVDNPPPGRYFGLCGLRVNRPVREQPPAGRTQVTGDTNPLTGLPIDPARLAQRIFVARYGNEPAVRASYGIGAADLVFEELMDDLNTTRFTSVWLGGDAPQIGPLRSFRSTTIQVAQIFDAPMASSGAVGPNQVFAYQAGIEDLDERCYSGPYFNNPAGGGYQNRVLTSSANLRAFLQNNGLNTGVKIKPFAFSDAAPSGGQAANRVVIPYANRGFYEVEWRYDPATGRYARFSGSARNPLVDGNNGQQVTASNVVIVEVQHDRTDLVEDIVNSYSVRTYIAGREGLATIIRDGVAIQGRWRALDKFSGLELVDAAGNPIPLKPGQTWFQVVPPNYGVTIVG